MQPYHGRSYVGDHCHKYFVNNIYTKCTDAILKKTKEITKNDSIINKAKTVKLEYDDLNDSYYKIHVSISHSNPILEEDIDAIETSIRHYMHLYRTHFPGKVLPKHHILEAHCIPFIRRFKFGLGKMGEQGGELVHQTVASLERRGRCIRNKGKKTKFIMTEQQLMTSPELQSCRPTLEKRQKRNK